MEDRRDQCHQGLEGCWGRVPTGPIDLSYVSCEEDERTLGGDNGVLYI